MSGKISLFVMHVLSSYETIHFCPTTHFQSLGLKGFIGNQRVCRKYILYFSRFQTCLNTNMHFFMLTIIIDKDEWYKKAVFSWMYSAISKDSMFGSQLCVFTFHKYY